MKFLKGKTVVIESRYVRGWEWRERTDYKGAQSELYVIIVAVSTGLHICQNSLNGTFKLGKLCCKWSIPQFFKKPISVGLRKNYKQWAFRYLLFSLIHLAWPKIREVKSKERNVGLWIQRQPHPTLSLVSYAVYPAGDGSGQSFTWYLRLNRLDFE